MLHKGGTHQRCHLFCEYAHTPPALAPRRSAALPALSAFPATTCSWPRFRGPQPRHTRCHPSPFSAPNVLPTYVRSHRWWFSALNVPDLYAQPPLGTFLEPSVRNGTSSAPGCSRFCKQRPFKKYFMRNRPRWTGRDIRVKNYRKYSHSHFCRTLLPSERRFPAFRTTKRNKTRECVSGTRRKKCVRGKCCGREG